VSLTVLNPRVHLVKDTGAARYFRRRLNEPDVMTFWHSITGQWILAFWLHRGKRIVEEIEDLGPNCESVTPAFVEMIVQAYGPVNLQAKKRLILSRQKDRMRKQNDDILADQERWDWARKRLKDKCILPYAFSTPMSRGEVLPARAL